MKTALPDREVVCLVGDGALLFGQIESLWTASRYDIPVLIVILNNRSYDNERNRIEAGSPLWRNQDTRSQWKDVSGYLGRPDVDFAGLAKSFDIEAATCTKPEELRKALRRAKGVMAEGRPFLIDAVIMQLDRNLQAHRADLVPADLDRGGADAQGVMETYGIQEHSASRACRCPSVGLGCMNFGMMNDQAQATAIVNRAHRARRQLLRYRGRLRQPRHLRGVPGQGARRAPPRRHRRHQVCRPDVPEQAWMQGGSRRWIMQAVEGSLRRLGTDYIDLYQMHRADTAVPVEETLRALDDLVRQGKLRYIGCSNYAAWQIADAAWTAREHHLAPFISAQNRYSLMSRDLEKEVVPAVDRSTASASCRTSRWRAGCCRASIVRARHFPADSRLAKWGTVGSRRVRLGGQARASSAQLFALCDRYDHTPAAARDGLARRQAVRLERHRRRDDGEAARAERRGGRMARRRRGTRRDRQDLPAAGDGGFAGPARR